MAMDSDSTTPQPPPAQAAKRRMRSACNACHFAKLRCSGGSPCSNCQVSRLECAYVLSNPLGRPRGVKNKRPQQDQLASSSTTTWRIMEPAAVSQRPLPRQPEDDMVNKKQINSLPPSTTPTTSASPVQAAADLTNSHSNLNFIHEHPDSHALAFATNPGPLAGTHNHPNIQYADLYNIGDGDGAYMCLDDDSRQKEAMNTFLAASQHPHVAHCPEPDMEWQQWLQESNPNAVRTDSAIYSPLAQSLQNPSSYNGKTVPCTCIQIHTEVLSHLRHITVVPVDVLLKAAQRTLSALKQLVECGECFEQGPNEEVMLLAALSLRKMLRLFHAYSSPESSSGEGTPSLSSGASSTDSMGAGSTRSASLAGSSCDDATSVAIGDYHLEGEDRGMVGQMLALQNLGRIRRIVANLLERIEVHRQKQGFLPEESASTAFRGYEDLDWGDSDLELVHAILYRLDAVADRMGQVLQWKHRVSMGRMCD